jgi:hypothetical protein
LALDALLHLTCHQAAIRCGVHRGFSPVVPEGSHHVLIKVGTTIDGEVADAIHKFSASIDDFQVGLTQVALQTYAPQTNVTDVSYLQYVQLRSIKK